MTKVAFCFPGQGSLEVGMGREIAEAVPEAMEVYRLGSEVTGMDLAHLCFEGPLEELVETEVQQPTLVTTSLAILAAVREPIEVVVVRPTDVDKEPVYREVDRVLEQMQRAQHLLTRRAVDPAVDPERWAALAAELDLAEDDLGAFGALLVRRGPRQRARRSSYRLNLR